MPATVFWPLTPTPASVSAPAYIDPRLSFRSDSGYLVQRPRASRPRRRYTLTYLGLRTDQLRTITDVLLAVRLGAISFGFIHPTASETVTMHNLTPVVLTFPSLHGLMTGFWLWIVGSIPATPLDGAGYQVTRINGTQVSLNGTTAQGADRPSTVCAYLPWATCVLQEDTMPEPTKLIGPEQGTLGRFNAAFTLEEIF